MKDSHLFRPNVESKGTEHHGTRLENTLKGVMLVQQRALFVVMKHKVVARMKSVALTMRSGSYVIKVSELNLASLDSTKNVFICLFIYWLLSWLHF